MRKIKRILAVPIILILELLKILINLLIKAECWVAGVGFLLLAIFSALAIFNKMWPLTQKSGSEVQCVTCRTLCTF